MVQEPGGEADDVEDEERGRRQRCRSWEFLQAEVGQQVAGEAEFGGDAVGELGAGARAQLGGQGLPGVGLDLQVVGQRGRPADEPGQDGLEDGRAWR